MAIIVTSGMKNPPKKLEILQFLPRFQALPLFIPNAWFPRYVFLMWKKEHGEMCICGFVFQGYGKSNYGFRIYRIVYIILTYSLENGERGHVDGSNLLFVHCTCI